MWSLVGESASLFVDRIGEIQEPRNSEVRSHVGKVYTRS
ncbi:hypothetical protein GXM_10148 [Nostoc sphaeroides CCNUC1]|uniref:Uncharacterized protein n=1 Tax=Nostoc sphaeroides CCNUC1 TaxID=2653204 RepID=A0A5P8WJI8_9NOSO|nr:hypothetical protein GXM_10148 [Nostoc sphaeroides CCNUC1]